MIGDPDTYDPRQHYAFSSDNTTNNIKQLIICLPDSTTSCTQKVANYTKAIKDIFTQAACLKKRLKSSGVALAHCFESN